MNRPRASAAGFRRAAGPVGLGVDLSGALNLVGALLKYFSLAFLFPAAIGLGYGESVWPFLGAGAITAAVWLRARALTQGKERVSVREGFLVVALTWLCAAFFGSLPYLLADEPQLSGPLNASSRACPDSRPRARRCSPTSKA